MQFGRRLAHRERQRRQDGARVGCGDEAVRGHAEGAHELCDGGVQLGRRRAHRERRGDKTLRVWDVATRQCVATLEGTRTV